mmetsp:Transcript_106861/g.228192  ORF Transcript_106861/g.228192 Transcript_106861/m.228192 type:complete len:209 (+) Transcript_106861:94-720(+)
MPAMGAVVVVPASGQAAPRRRRFPAFALAALLVVVALAGGMFDEAAAFMVGGANAAAAAGAGARAAAAANEAAPQRGLVTRRVRHVSIPTPAAVAAQKNSPEHKFDEDGGLYDIIKYPLLTEKACRLIEEHNTYTFLVDRRANKPQIRAAIETIFDVKVMKCNTLIPLARYTIKFGRKIGRKSVFKKAMCRLKEGYTIDLFPDDPETA